MSLNSPNDDGLPKCPCAGAMAPEAEAVPDIMLSEAKLGSMVFVSGVLGGRKVGREMADLGLRRGQQITVLRRLLGGGVAVRYSTMTIAVGAQLARKLMVRSVCSV